MTLQEMPDFDSAIKRELLVLLECIEQLMNTLEKAKYPALTTVEILSNFLRCKQGKKESLLDYLSRFKSERDVVYRILGKKFLDGFAENLPGWDNSMSDDDKKKFKEKELKKFLAVLFLRNADYGTYNELLVEYRKAYANKQDIYPKSLEDVLDVLRQIQPKKKKVDNNNRNSNNGNKNEGREN